MNNVFLIILLHFFVLIQRNEAKKNQGKPDRSARFAKLALTSVFKPQTTNLPNQPNLGSVGDLR
jgi:hypothetical protein